MKSKMQKIMKSNESVNMWVNSKWAFMYKTIMIMSCTVKRYVEFKCTPTVANKLGGQ